MKAVLTHSPPVPEAPTSALGRRLGQLVSRFVNWLLPASAEDARPATPASPQEIEALEKQIRKVTEAHRFTGFPC